jgi:hypothetical protein
MHSTSRWCIDFRRFDPAGSCQIKRRLGAAALSIEVIETAAQLVRVDLVSAGVVADSIRFCA